MLKVVGTMFFQNDAVLIVKPRNKSTYQMVGGKVELGETPFEASVREAYEELGNKVVLDRTKFEFVMDFKEIATSDQKTEIHFYVFKYNGDLIGELTPSCEIEKFLWYQSENSNIILSNTLRREVIPYCLTKKLIK